MRPGAVNNGDGPPGLVAGAHLQEGLADWETPRGQHAGRGYRIPSGGACGSARDLLVLAHALLHRLAGMQVAGGDHRR